MDERTVAAVLARGELTEEEAVFVLRFAGRAGYKRAIQQLEALFVPWWLRALEWLIRFSGWRWPLLSQWDRGEPAWSFRLHLPGLNRWTWKSPWPVALLGGRVVLMGWGLHVHLRGRYLCWTWRRHMGRKVYLSPNGTPGHPDAWFLFGART